MFLVGQPDGVVRGRASRLAAVRLKKAAELRERD